jgi:hypothetical protein
MDACGTMRECVQFDVCMCRGYGACVELCALSSNLVKNTLFVSCNFWDVVVVCNCSSLFCLEFQSIERHSSGLNPVLITMFPTIMFAREMFASQEDTT